MPEMALRLSFALGSSLESWMGHQEVLFARPLSPSLIVAK